MYIQDSDHSVCLLQTIHMYQIYTVPVSIGTFQLDAESGHLTVAIQANLDRETNTGYTLMVQAENNLATGGTPATVSSLIGRVLVPFVELN